MEERLTSVDASEVGSAGRNWARRDCVRTPSPPATTFVAATEWLENGVPVVSVTGDLDLATGSVLEEALLGLAEGAEGAVIVDLTSCDFIDLRGLRVLLAARERLERSNRPLALVVGKPSLLRVFKITRVDDLFEIHPSRAAAVKDSDRG